MINRHEIDGQAKIIAGRIHQLWSEAFNDRIDAIEGELTQIAGLLQREFGLTLEQALTEVDRWRSAYQPRAMIEAQWLRFNDVLQDRWIDLRICLQDGGAKAEDLREVVTASTGDLIAVLQARYQIGKDEAAGQVQAWLDDVRRWIEANRRDADLRFAPGGRPRKCPRAPATTPLDDRGGTS